ncbi:MAG TPA: xanthine dehydrogenase family protein subunit M [Roseiarcus sp.]|nr:xanthine dehydrogenase family protein subunit M [Roseiarcus sp.]
MYARPTDLEAALTLLAEPGARVLAGGTDIFPATGERPLTGRHIDVTAVKDLRALSVAPDAVRFGAALTWSDIAKARLPHAFDALKEAAREVGGVQIQNRGTIAGNLCNASPAADGVPPLLILDAEVEIASRRGARRLPIAEFITGNRRTALAPDEIVTAIVVPAPAATMRSTFLKLGARRYLVISIVMVAVLLDIESDVVREARVAVGACSAAAKRLAAIERRLAGAPARPGLGATIAADDLAALAPIDDLRACADYRRDAALTLIRRAIEECLAGRAGGVV